MASIHEVRTKEVLRPVKNLLFSVILAICLSGSVGFGCPVGDLDGNCKVDFDDLRIFALQWLGDEACSEPNCADLDGVGGVTMPDFALFSAAWLKDQTGLVISEFMAVNRSSLPLEQGDLLDEDGKSSDWIEIYNPMDTTVNLEDWRLTDDINDLTQWAFPAGIELAPGQFLVVFASGKNRRDPNESLHTNFKLDGDDPDDLALVTPDGVTIVQKYAPFPVQLADISYGSMRPEITLVPTGAAASYLVPTVDLADSDWTALDFNDSKWDIGPTPLSFDIAPLETGRDIGNPSAVGSHSVDGGVYTVTADGDDIWGTEDSFHFVYTALTGDGELTARVVELTNAGSWAKIGVMIRETLESNSAHAMTIVTGANGASFQHRSSTGSTMSSTEVAGPSTPHWVRIVRENDTFTGYHSEDGSNWSKIADLTIGMADDVYAGLAVTSHSDGELCTAVFDNVSGSSEATENLKNKMLGVNSSLWTRIQFDLDSDQAETFNTLALRIKFEDGFTAFLNGEKIAQNNSPDSLDFNSTALSDRPFVDSFASELIDLTPFLHLLGPGKNVLAIAALNDNESDDEFLIQPELIAGGNADIPQYFTTPTPGSSNVSGALGRVGEVRFSHKRGLYDRPPGWSFQLTLSVETDRAEIRYTLDGSRPAINHGSVYENALTIDCTSVVRAVAVKPGFLDSDVETHTYIFISDVITQSPSGEAPGPAWPSPGRINGQNIDYGMDPDVVNDPAYADLMDDAMLSIPTISIVTNADNLFDPSYGIYVNAREDGRAWERPASVELINPDGSEAFQIDAGLRIRGGWSRSGYNPKHSFRLFFRSEYGPPKLEYPLFGDEGTDEFDNIDLRTAQNYSWSGGGNSRNTMVREVFSRDVQGQMGHPYTRSRYCHLLINGHYWGLFQTQERSEASYAKSYFGGEKSDYDVIKVQTGPYTIAATDGTLDAYRRLWQAAVDGFETDRAYYGIQGLNTDGTPNASYEKLLDVDNLIDYLLIIYYGGNLDSPVGHFMDNNGINNFCVIYNRNNPTGFKTFIHDAEHSLMVGKVRDDLDDELYRDRTGPFPVGAEFLQFNPQWLHQQLVAHPEYVMRFADHVHKHFFNDGILTPDAATARFTARKNQIDLAIIAESARWGDAKRTEPRTRNDDWLAEINRIVNDYLPFRSGIVLNQIVSKGWYPRIAAPAFSHLPGSSHTPFDLSITGGGAIWCTTDGNDPRRPGGATNPDAISYGPPIHIDKSTHIKARVKSAGTWSALNEAIFAVGPVTDNLRITELMYHPRDTGDPNDPNEEFIELQNIGGTSINLNLVRFTNGVDFTFGDIELAPGWHLVVVRDRMAFEAQYPAFSGVIAGEYIGRLNNGGERVELVDAIGRIIHSFRYRDAWQSVTDGRGYSLTIIDPANPDPNSWNEQDAWRPSAYIGGSPGYDDSGEVVGK